ncbi:hypothetical protein FGG08_005712 [Glutinoglossum americanum]|uniref:Telomere-associated protein Rif1 N-terminal domain-containing protein n=1 Tax=Glutinoglossum americanum TaxID=1670608 RepID=A0A9P8HU06_9PEZI|nr:hypothetical protein FGG08_005712 [Glutinoglossum americanum]
MPLPLAVPSPAFSYVPLGNFDDLTPRPPTPPRDSKASDVGTALLRDSTPRSNSPSSTDSSHHQTSGKARKRVGFSPLRTSYHRLPTFSGDSTYSTPLKPLPPSRERKSSKSILKPFERPVPLHPADFPHLQGQGILAHSYDNFATMLQSVVQQLAGTLRSNRIDAYMAISGTLKAYQDGTPDLEAMTKQMGLFMQFIQRDMCATSESGSLDTGLITKALKLLTIFFWSPQLSGALTDEFCSFVLDHAIAAVEDAQTPKTLTIHYVHLLVHQKFSPKVMTASRANRLVTALHQDHIKGTGLTAERLVVYQRLLGQARPVMTSRAAEWTEHLFSSVLSPIKEIQCRAVDFGMEAGIALGAVREVSRVISGLFNRETEGTIFAEYLGKRLSKMVADKEDGAHAAKVWSVVVLFFRCRPHQLEHWEHIQLWLRVIQECFNSSDMAIRNHASLAWNKLVYSINPDAETSEKTIKMLRIPISGPLEKKGNDRFSVNGRQMALASLCNLLYYSLSPRAPMKQLDLCWDEYVEEVLGKVFLTGAGESDQACRILAALFDGRQPKSWTIDRATQAGAVTAEELPRLDSKWVRSRTNKILKIIEVALSRASWDDELNDEAPIQRLWLNFTKTISDAGSLEVKISNELMEAMAHMFNMFQRVWKAGPGALGVGNKQPKNSFLKRFGFLTQTAMAHIGTISFTEKVLSLDSQQQFEAVSTPSHRSSSGIRGPKLLVSPVLHLFQLYLQPPVEVAITPLYYDMVRETLEACCNSRGSRRTRLELLKQCIQALPTAASAYAQPTHATAVWQVIAGLAEKAMLMAPQEKALNSPQPVGHEYRDMRSVLEWGVRNHQSYHFQIWHTLFMKFVDSVKQEMGNGGVAAAVVEPLAGTLKSEKVDYNNGIILTYGALVLDITIYPRNREALEIAQKALWGLSIGARKTPSFDPFDHLYQMINYFLAASYENLPSIDSNNARTFLARVSSLVGKCPLSLLSILLKRIQEGVAVWVEDTDHKLNEKDSGVFKTVSQLWTGVCSAVRRLPRKDSFVLKTLSTLISCGLGSRRKAIANATAELWNSTFGLQETLDYPLKVKNALQRLRPIADLQLPTFPESAEDEIAATPPEFSESQEEDDYATREHVPFSSPTPAPNIRTVSSREGLHLPIRGTSYSPLRAYTPTHTPEKASGLGSAKLTPKPRLRHDDSQIQFAPIQSSPIDDAGMDSQVLTDHQRDVRERQQMDAAAMFPDIRSSPNVVIPRKIRRFRHLSVSPDLLSARELAMVDSSTPMLPPPSRSLEDDFIESSPIPEGDYTPPSSPPVPTEEHATGQEIDLSLVSIEAHEEAELEDTSASDIFRTSVREYPDQAGVDGREPDPPVEASRITGDKVESPVPPANTRYRGKRELETPNVDSGEPQEEELRSSGQENKDVGETPPSPRSELANSQDSQPNEIPEAPKTPFRLGLDLEDGVLTAGSGFFTPERRSRVSDLFTNTPQSPRELREEHTVEVPGTADDIRSPLSERPSPTGLDFSDIHLGASTPDGKSASSIIDSHARSGARAVAFADSIETSGAEESGSKWRKEPTPTEEISDSHSSLQPVQRKRKRVSISSPKKVKKSKPEAKEEEPMGDCIIVLPSPQTSPPVPVTKKTIGRKTKNAIKSPVPFSHSSEGFTRMSSVSYDRVTPLTHPKGSRKRLASQSIVPDEVETPTSRTKRTRRSNPTTPMSSTTRRMSTRLCHISVPSPEPTTHDSGQDGRASPEQDVSRIEDSQAAATTLGEQAKEMEDVIVFVGKNETKPGSAGLLQRRVSPDGSDQVTIERNLGDENILVSENGDEFETAPEGLGVPGDTIAVSAKDKPSPMPAEPTSGKGTHHSSREATSERGSITAPSMGRGIIGGLRKILRDIQRVVLGREEATEIHSLLDDIGNRVDEAATSQRV